MSTFTDSIAHWTCNRKSEISLKIWQDGYVLYDEAQGQLHCLSPLAGGLIEVALVKAHWTSAEMALMLLCELPTEEDQLAVENVAMHFESIHILDRYIA